MLSAAKAWIMTITLPAYTNLSIEHYRGAIDGEPISSWLQQLGASVYDFPSDEAQKRVLETDELWILHWQDHRGAHFFLAPTFRELIDVTDLRFPTGSRHSAEPCFCSRALAARSRSARRRTNSWRGASSRSEPDGVRR
jgi:hypothetical protein